METLEIYGEKFDIDVYDDYYMLILILKIKLRDSMGTIPVFLISFSILIGEQSAYNLRRVLSLPFQITCIR